MEYIALVICKKPVIRSIKKHLREGHNIYFTLNDHFILSKKKNKVAIWRKVVAPSQNICP